MTDVFREVDEEVRREQYLKLWRAYGKYFVAGALLIIVAAGGYQGYREYQRRQAVLASERFAIALSDARAGRQKEAADAFRALAGESPGGYQALAGLQAAAALAAAGEIDQAIAAYDRVTAASSVDQHFRDLAQVLAALQLMERNAPADAEGRVRPIASGKSAFRFSAREILGLIALKNGDAKAARDAFTLLSDDAATPPGIRARAAEMLAVLGESK